MDNDEIDQGMEAAAALSHFTLKVDNVKHLFSIVSAIYNGKKDSYAMIRANHKGAPRRSERGRLDEAGGRRRWRCCLLEHSSITAFKRAR